MYCLQIIKRLIWHPSWNPVRPHNNPRPQMGDRPASLRKEKSNALARARISYTLAQVSGMLRTALLHTWCDGKIHMSFPVHNVSSEPLCLGLTSHEGAEIPLCIILLDENTGNCPLSKHYLIWSLTIIMCLIVVTSQLDTWTLEDPKSQRKGIINKWQLEKQNGKYLFLT
jgi:hypothetical protein